MTFWEQITDAAAREVSDLVDVDSATRVVVRLLAAVLLGGCLGYEREKKGKSAGLRTHMLVALGSALFVLAPREAGAGDDAMARVIQGLLAGIGFLGAGAIVKGRPTEGIQGLTTAATIWMTAAIGMTVAMGRLLTATIATLVALAILHIFTAQSSGVHASPPTLDAHASTKSSGPDAGPN
jgi:putative Mg2+ transporter-C (MgtC) family protein